MEAHKIPPLFPKHIYINNLWSFNTFSKRQYNYINILSVLYPQKAFVQAQKSDKRMLKRMVTLFKKVKGVQQVRMGDCNIQNRNNAIAKSTKIAKRVRHAKALTLTDFLPSQKQPVRLTLWLKQAKSLKTLNYRILPKDFSFKDPVSFEDGVKKLFRAMRLNKVTVLRISELISDSSLSRAFIIFNDYPKSLERLSIHWEGYMPKIQVNPPQINTTLDHVKKLESLSLKLDDQIKIVDYALKSVAPLEEVKSLNLSLPVGITPENSTNLNKIQDFKNLKRLKLRMKVWKKDTKLFFQFLERMRFTSLILILNIENNKPLKSVKDFLSQHKNLETLQLKIENQSLFKAESTEDEQDSLGELLDLVGQFKSMKSLKLMFKTRARVTESDLLPDFTPRFKSALENSESLKVFKFCCNQVKPKETFLGLAASLKKNAKTLHNLTIDAGECVPEGTECRMTMNLLKDLKLIQILEIPSLCIACPYFIQDVVEVIYSLKYLRELILGEFKEGVSKNGFIDAVEKILLKKGVNKFNCSASRELNRLLTKKTEGSRKLNIDEIKGKNPSLLQYPNNLPIFLKSKDETDW